MVKEYYCTSMINNYFPVPVCLSLIKKTIFSFIFLFTRGYNQEKISNNVQCEIFQTILDEARESYNENVVHELVSNLPEELERNVDLICEFVHQWCSSSSSNDAQ